MSSKANTAEFLSDLRNILTSPGDVRIAVAFVTKAGLDEIRAQLLQKLESGGSVRILIDLKEGTTDPSALWDLLTLVNQPNYQLELRAYVPTQGILHSKLFLNVYDDSAQLLTGSANLSFTAFYENVEHGIHAQGTTVDNVIGDAISNFDTLWFSNEASTIDEEAARLYETYCGRRRAILTRSQRRSTAAWNELIAHFQEGPALGFHWPSPSAAYILGVITARGYLYPESNKIVTRLLFRPRSYANEQITVRGLSFDAATVLPTIPQAIAEAATPLFPSDSVSINGNTVSFDLSSAPEIFEVIEGLFVPEKDCDSFRLPREMTQQDDGIISSFVRGFAVACALLTDQTSMPGNRWTGLPGQMVVWLRPKQSNPQLFGDLYELINRRLHLRVYRHERLDRDPHLKVPCEDFAEIGFGLDWWDQLVNCGAEYNQTQFGKPLYMNLFETT